MADVVPIHHRPSNPPEMEARAMDNLRFIRETMERAGTFTALSGWGQVVIGLTAIAAALISSRVTDSVTWLGVWLAEAAIATVISVASMTTKSEAANMPLFSGPIRKLVLSFSPPILAGCALTLVLRERKSIETVPAGWMVRFVAGVISAGA